MKKLFLKTMLLTVLMAVGGLSSAWAQTVLYERGTTNAWAATDVAEGAWSAGAIGGNGLEVTNGVASNLTIAPTSNSSVLTWTVTWNPGNATGTANNTNAYIRFGDVTFAFYGSSWFTKVTIGSTTTQLSGGGATRGRDYIITVSINQATNEVSYTFNDNGTEITGAGTTASAGLFTTLTHGLGGKSPSWTNTSTLKKVEITETMTQTSYANYTVKYMCGDLEIKDPVLRTTEAGGSIYLLDSDKESFITNDQSVKYVYASDNAAGQTVASDGSTIVIVQFTGYNKVDYNVKAVDGAGNVLTESIASVSGYSDQPLELFWSKYVKIGDTWYVADAPFYQGNITETGEKSVTYTVSDIDYFIECENMIGVRPDRWVLEYSSNYSGYRKIRQNSYYRTIYTADLEEGGLYDLVLPYNNSNSSNSSHTIQTRASNGDVTDIAEWTTESGANKIYRLESINIPAGSSLALYYGGSGNSNARMDYLTLTKSSVNYTVKYMCGNTEIKTAVAHQAKWGTAPVILDTDKEDVVLDNVKYVYASDNASDVTVAADGSTVVIINFTEISKVNYSVKAMAGNDELATIIEGSDFPGTEISYGYSQYLAKDGVLYQSSKQNTNPWWGKSFTLNTEDYTATVNYTATSTTGIVFCKEAEDIEGLSKVSTGNTIIRASNKDGAYATAATTITTLPAGKYKIYGACYGNAGTTFNITAGNATVFTVSTNGNPTHTTGEEFTLTTSTDIVLQTAGQGGSNAKSMDYIIIQKTGEYVPPTIDITDLYLTNPSFETGDLTGWTTTNGEDTGVKENSNDTYKTTGVDGSYLFNTWWHGYPVTQTIAELPAATYKLSALITSDGGYQTLFANNSESAEISRTTIQPTNKGEFNDVNILFTLANVDNVTIGARGSNSADSYDDAFWYKADNFRLSLVLEDDATIPAAIVAKIEAANPVNQGTVGSVVAAAYTQAKSTFESNATLANYEAYLAAVANYNMSVAQYAAINSESGALPIDNTDGWAISTKNGTLARNTWSTEGNSDGSGMTTPFIQDWVGSGTPLTGGEDGGKLYYRLLLTPGETYAVTALVRAFNEAGTGVTGATYYVGDDEKSIDELGSACTGSYSAKGMFGTFTCTGTVGEDGVLEFGVKLASNSPINWLSIKDIVIKESSDVKPTGITLSQTSATLTTGDALTITATITPDDASDQTIQWTSSNEAVATVSGGVVVAVSAGTATITAKAVAGNNVTATATITVADAPALAYATAISGTGQYLLRNVATGKYLNAGNAWGTQATLSPQGVLLTATLADGTYKLTDIVASTNGLGSDGYCDNGTPVALTVTAVAGKNNVYTISPAAGKYVAGQAGSTVVTMTATDAASALAQWQFIGENELKKNISVATAENPFDVTYYIMDPNFSRNNGYLSSWTMTANNKNLGGGDNTNFVAESWHSSNGFDLSQTLTVPNGTYRLRAQAAGSGTPAEVYVYANDVTTPFTTIANGENSMSAMSASFTAGLYNTEWAEVTVTDNKLKVGAKTSRTDTWCVFDNFQLQFVGYVPVTAINATIDKNEIGTLETATITASVNPEKASFTGITYTSSNESVATVSADGVVTGVAAGQATITVKAEVDNVETTIAVTVIESVLATAEDYAALNEAINSHVMGFLEGEYAPYNNAAESFATVTAAKAIDQTVDNLQSTVQAATQAITGATWVVNTEEVNAFYDGTFAAATNNGAPNGWRMSNNSLGGSLHSRAFVGDNRLSEFNKTNSAFFIRFDGTNSDRGSMYYYGDTEGYTMPLKADTYYRVTVDFAGWGSTGKTLRMNVTGPDGFSAKTQEYTHAHNADTESDYTPQQFNIVFKTGSTEGNYVINFQCPGSDNNKHNAVISNLRLFTEPESSATLAVTAAKYGTFIAPFDVTLPEGVTAYTVTDGDQLTMTEVTNNTIPANTPVVVSSEEVVSETVKGYSLAIKDSYTMEALTGTYVDIDAPNGSYILQNQNGKVGFYKVDTSVAQPKVRANRAYLISGSSARSFLFEDSETVTAINAVKALTEGEALIYDMNGVQQPRLKKGMNIIRTKDGRTQKLMVR